MNQHHSAGQISNVGPLLASTIVAGILDPAIFGSGRNLAAWIGLVPRQNFSGGQERLGCITKAGHRYPRQMPIVSAMAVVRYAWLMGKLQNQPLSSTF